MEVASGGSVWVIWERPMACALILWVPFVCLQSKTLLVVQMGHGREQAIISFFAV